MTKSLILCDCMGTQQLDAQGLEQTTGLRVTTTATALCTDQIATAAAALEGGETVFCCAQEARLFAALAAETGHPAPPVLDLRDRAGWSTDPASKLPKMSALVAEALLPTRPEKTLDVHSSGRCLILGPAPVALKAAQELQTHLGVTVLLEPGADLPDTRAFDVITGHLRMAQGAFGHFRVTIDALQLPAPGGRGAPRLSAPRDGGHSECDIIVDLRGKTPLFPAPEKREGYLRADPSHAPAVAAAVMAASHLTGDFEKPLYIHSAPELCAHSRAEQTGCTRCLDLCPTGAISPGGEHVSIDPMICAGCGACSAVCPSGAISYDAPAVDQTMVRVQTLARAYLQAGGQNPHLLVGTEHMSQMVQLSARYGRGLPAHVIPMEVPALNLFGHAEALAAISAGFVTVSLLPGPGTDRVALQDQILLCAAIAGEARIRLIEPPEPDALEEILYTSQVPPLQNDPVRPMGSRRQIARQAARALHPEGAVLQLPPGAPYGAVEVDTDSCTLCLSCVSLCPSGALVDNPDAPELRFQEDACLQCGLCAQICPEDAISYDPRLDLSDAALSQRILHREEPFACIECGALFGVKSTIDRITEKLRDHAMFAGSDKLRMIQMCDTCRVNAQYHAEDSPFAAAPRPKVRTTDDYLSKRRDH